MNNIIKRKWNQNSMVIIEDLQGMAFQAESGGHTFQISGIDGEGNAVALSGTPAGVMLRADGQDVTLTCSASEGVISATLPANAYSVPGRFGLTIFLTSDGQKTAIYAAVGTVGKTSSGTVAPPAGSDVVTLVNQINTAIAAIPANYNACFAPAYSTSGLYSVGQYVTYNGNLYRCNTAITTAETWTAAHWTQTNLGADVYDLKSALNAGELIDSYTWEDGTINAQGQEQTSTTQARTVGYTKVDKYAKYKVTTGSEQVIFRLYDNSYNFLSSKSVSANNSESVDFGFLGASYFRAVTKKPAVCTIYKDVVQGIENEINKTEKEYNTFAGDGKNAFILDWEKGTINASGVNDDSTSYVRTPGYVSVLSEKYEYHCVAISENVIIRLYNSSKAFIGSLSVTAGNDTVVDLTGVSYVRFVASTTDGKCDFYSLIYPYVDKKVEYLEDKIVETIAYGDEINTVWEQGSINASGEDTSSNTLYRTVGYIRAVVGDKYIVTASISNGFVIRWYDSEKVYQETYGNHNGVSGETGKSEFIAKYPYFRIVNNSADTTNYPPASGNITVYKKIFLPLDGVNYYRNLYGNKKIDCLGDSFTARDDGWWSMIASFTGWDMKGYGVTSSRISKDYVHDGVTVQSFLNRYSGMDTTADCVIIFGGINDCVYLQDGTITMGDMSSALNSDTFYGSLRLLIESIHNSEFMPDALILGVIPPDFYLSSTTSEILEQVREAEREIYAYYGIPYIDLKKDCQFMYKNTYYINKYRQTESNMHPSADGYKAIATVILNGLEFLLKGNFL